MRYLTPLLTLVIPFLLCGLSWAQGRRDPWDRIQQFDANKDGKISREEFTGPERFFDRMDADKDGFVTKEEAQNMRRGQGGRGGMGGRGGGMDGGRGGQNMLTQRMDTDKDGKVSKAEWDACFKKPDENGDEFLQSEELRAAVSGRRLRDDAPKVGADVPKVKAVSAKDGRAVDLSKPRRTTVLVFGSWT